MNWEDVRQEDIGADSVSFAMLPFPSILGCRGIYKYLGTSHFVLYRKVVLFRRLY